MVPAQLRGAYTGKQFKAIVCTEMTIPADAGLWAGGSRDRYSAIDFASGRQVSFPGQQAAPWDDSRRERHIKLEPSFAVVEHTIFQGKDLGLTFYLHPDNATKLLPPSHELSECEKLVLLYTATRKSSYMGKDRYAMAIDDARYGYGENRNRRTPTREQWDAAKQSLIGKTLLNKAGAITPAGRNAIR
jgi:hypothetical protein